MPPFSGKVGHVTAMPPTWAILVPTLGERRALFERLMGVLLPQLEPHTGRVQVIGWLNNGQPSLPEIRHRMLTGAGTDYVSFVDDDDLVSPDYVDEIVTALGQNPDYVGFQVQCYSDGVPTAIAHHSLAHGHWMNLADRHLRDISHLNPIRRTLALTGDFRKARRGQPEDRAWADQLRRSGVLRSEVVVPRILYHYLYSTGRKAGLGSRARRPTLIKPTAGRAAVGSDYFTWSSHA
jgi:hypothetical protein